MSAKKKPPVRRTVPRDDENYWSFFQPGRISVGWCLDESMMNGKAWTDREIDHARGRRNVRAHFELSALLATLAATKVGRAAMLKALLEHEA